MKKCCISTCIVALVILVLIVAAVVVVLNLTPAQLHFADVQLLEGISLADYGLGDVKLIKIINGAKGLATKENKVVSNGYNAETAGTAANALFAGSNYADTTDYSGLLNSDALYDKTYVRSASDTTLAYVLNNALGKSYSGSEGSSVLAVREVTVAKTDDGANMRVVLGLNTTQFVSALGTVADTASKANISVPEYCYVVCTADFTVGTADAQAGKVVFSNCAASLAGNAENPLNDLVLGLVDKAFGFAVEEAAQSDVVFSQNVFDKVASTINHIGAVGTASTDPTTGVAMGTKNYGMSGVQGGDNQQGALVFITTQE